MRHGALTMLSLNRRIHVYQVEAVNMLVTRVKGGLSVGTDDGEHQTVRGVAVCGGVAHMRCYQG